MRRWRIAAASVGAGVAAIGVLALIRLPSAEPRGADEQAAVAAVDGDDPFAGEQAVTTVDRYMEALLSADLAATIDSERLADLFRTALSVSDGRDQRLDSVASAVSREGVIHSPGLPVALAEVVADEVSWVDDRVNAELNGGDGSAVGGAADLYAVHDLLREILRDEAAAEVVWRGLDDYGATALADAPAEGPERDARLAELGSVYEVMAMAQRNAEEGAAVLEGDADAIDAAIEAHGQRRADWRVRIAMWIARDRLESDQAVRDAARGHSFIGSDGEVVPEPRGDVLEEFGEWANSLTGPSGTLREDWNAIAAGIGDIDLGPVSLVGRF